MISVICGICHDLPEKFRAGNFHRCWSAQLLLPALAPPAPLVIGPEDGMVDDVEIRGELLNIVEWEWQIVATNI